MTIYPQLVFISQIYALFWRAIYRLKNAVAYKKLQIWGMHVCSVVSFRKLLNFRKYSLKDMVVW